MTQHSIPAWIVLFDWDGTLIDSLDIKISNAGMVFEQALGVPREKVEATYRRHSGVPRRAVFEAICRENGLPELSELQFDILSRQFSQLNRAALIESPPNVPRCPRCTHRPHRLRPNGLVPADTWATLQVLTRQGFPLYVSSSADPREIREIAQALGLDQYFVEILGSVPGFGKGKQHVDYILCQQNTTLEHLAFVGDEPTDIALGKEAGVLTIAKVGTYPPDQLQAVNPDYVITSLEELLPYLLSRKN